jgi:lysophospholipase L1-like esterase
VLHVGDSILYLSTPELIDREVMRSRGYDARFNPILGSGLTEIDYWELRLRGLLARGDLDAVVVMLGTNDAEPTRFAQVDGDYEQRVERFLRAIPPRVPVVWLGPGASCLPYDVAALRRVSTTIESAVRARGNGVYLDPQPLLEIYLALRPDLELSALCHPDGVHYSEEGDRAISSGVYRALQKALGEVS